MSSVLIDQYDQTKKRLQDTAEYSGRKASEINLIVVSKTWGVETLVPLVEHDKIRFGENKVQELINKAEILPRTVEWHFIGRLQKNKIRKLLPFVSLIHSVDNFELAQQISRIAGELNLKPEILLQVNSAQELSKGGWNEEDLISQFPQILSLPHLQLKGLMCIPPWDEDPEQVRPYFRRLRVLRDTLAQRHNVELPHLSMGMSHDFEIAIQEGATFIRVGSAIFGERDYQANA